MATRGPAFATLRTSTPSPSAAIAIAALMELLIHVAKFNDMSEQGCAVRHETLQAMVLIELDGTKVPERAGRALDHETEDAFERLRVAGYL